MGATAKGAWARTMAAFVIAPGSGVTVTVLVVAPTPMPASGFTTLVVGWKGRVLFSAATTASDRLPKMAGCLSTGTPYGVDPNQDPCSL